MELPESTRKRLRNVTDDEISEFTPLSKRINNLHINNSVFSFSKAPGQSNDHMKTELHRTLLHEKLSALDMESSRNVDSVCEGTSRRDWGPIYSPDLTPAENPFYYESNRILYELYIERARRNGGPSSSNTNF